MTTRLMAGFLAVAVAVVSIAPAAEARGRGHGRRYKDHSSRSTKVVHHVHHRRAEYRRSSGSSIGPAILGFIGGLAIGATIAKASEHDHAAPVRSVHYYEDPYCHERYSSVSACRTHIRDHGHPPVYRKMSHQSGECVGTYGYEDGEWVQYGDGWDRDQGWED
jgi:hypothetical protein